MPVMSGITPISTITDFSIIISNQYKVPVIKLKFDTIVKLHLIYTTLMFQSGYARFRERLIDIS